MRLTGSGPTDAMQANRERRQQPRHAHRSGFPPTDSISIDTLAYRRRLSGERSHKSGAADRMFASTERTSSRFWCSWAY